MAQVVVVEFLKIQEVSFHHLTLKSEETTNFKPRVNP